MLINSRTIRGKCAVCGTQNATCGGPSAHTPVDEIKEAAVVTGPLEVYEYEPRPGVIARVKLRAAEAAKLGARKVEDQPKVRAAEPAPEPPAKTKVRRAATPRAGARTKTA